MELLFRLFAILLFCTPGVLGGCKEDIAQDSGFMECMMSFSSFFQQGMSGLDLTDENAMMEMVCSAEGIDAFRCVLDYVQKCDDVFTTPGGGPNPMESLTNMTGIDMVTFLKDGMEGVCAFIVGPCSEVKQCLLPNNGGGGSGGVVKRGAPSVNNYMMFVMQSDQICGPMKPQMDCMLEKLKECPPAYVDKVEDMFETAMKVSMPAQGIVSFQDTKEFMKECPYVSKVSPQQNSCVKSAFTSLNFTKCYSNVSKVYEDSNRQSCGVYEKNKACLMENVVENCGEQTTDFFIRNAHFIWPGIPSDCADQINSGIVAKMSFGVILISLFVSLIKNIY